MTFLPPDADTAYSLLQIISDPKAAKAYLDDIVAKTKDLQEAGETARTERIAADKSLTEAQYTLSQMIDFHNLYDTDYDMRTKKFDIREAELDARGKIWEDQKTSDTKEFVRNTAELADRWASVSAREKAVTALEQAAQKTQEEALALKADYDQKVSALQRAIS